MYSGTANHCVLNGNSGSSGGGKSGGIANTCSITSNITSSKGGGMYFGMANNCFIHGNFGGGCSAYVSRSGYLGGTMNNSIVWGNSAGGYNDNSYGFLANYSCSSDIPGGENSSITNNPLFTDAANGDYHLQSNSPCINWGDNAYVSGAVDLDDNPRIVEGYVDMGCYEYQGLIGEADNDGDGMSDAWERLWFGAHVSPGGNADGDIQSNGDEYVAGTDPTNGLSYFTAANSVAEVNGTNCFVVEWISIPDRLYSVQWSTNLVSGFETLETGLEQPQHSYTDATHNAETEGFYKVDVQMK